MKKEIDNNELELVTGGSVVVSSLGKVGFSTLGVKYKLHNCTWREARECAEDLLANHPQMTDVEFDQFVMNQFADKGWIVL